MNRIGKNISCDGLSKICSNGMFTVSLVSSNVDWSKQYLHTFCHTICAEPFGLVCQKKLKEKNRLSKQNMLLLWANFNPDKRVWVLE